MAALSLGHSTLKNNCFIRFIDFDLWFELKWNCLLKLNLDLNITFYFRKQWNHSLNKKNVCVILSRLPPCTPYSSGVQPQSLLSPQWWQMWRRRLYFCEKLREIHCIYHKSVFLSNCLSPHVPIGDKIGQHCLKLSRTPYNNSMKHKLKSYGLAVEHSAHDLKVMGLIPI